MASTKKSKKEEEKEKKKKKINNNKKVANSNKTPIKKTPNKNKDKNNNIKKKKIKNNKIKIPNGKVKESPEASIVSASSSDDSIEEIQEIVAKKELSKKTTKPKNQTSSKTDNKTKKRKVKEEDDDIDDDGTMCSFPMARIKRIIKTEDFIGSKLPQDVVFLVNKATEMFIEQFCEEAYECSVQDRKKYLAYKHLSSVVSEQRRFDFLSDFVPGQLKAEEALGLRKLMETAHR